MFDVELSQSWKEAFALAAEIKAEKKRAKRLEEALRQLDQDQHEKRKVEKQHEKEKEEAFEQLLATVQETTAFNERLDRYDAATVGALMENGEALDRVHAQLNAMLDQAFVLPDSRHAFKTEDGHRVFDEHGTELSPQIVSPDVIDDSRPRWEAFKAAQDGTSKLKAERHDLLEFQSKLDSARTRLDKGGVTHEDLDGLGADLGASMPQAIRQKLGLPESKMDAGVKTPVDRTARSSKLDDLIRNMAPQPAPM